MFTNAYGMTESGGATMPPGAPIEYVLSGSVGQISMGTEGKVVDLDTLETVPIGTEVTISNFKEKKQVFWLVIQMAHINEKQLISSSNVF